MTQDRFAEVIDKFLVPISEFQGPVMDSTYFLRSDDSFVFSEGYCHPPGAFWGMIIKYPLPGGHIDLFGRNYSWTHREYIDGELRMIPDDRQLENQFRIAPELKESQGDKPIFARHLVRFPLSGCRGCFDARSSRLEHRFWSSCWQSQQSRDSPLSGSSAPAVAPAGSEPVDRRKSIPPILRNCLQT